MSEAPEGASIEEPQAPAVAKNEPAVAPKPTAEPVAESASLAESDPKWLPDRLEKAETRGQAKLLEQLGISSAEELKAALEERKQLQDEKLSEAERQANKLAELEPKAARAAELEDSLKTYAVQELAKLDDAKLNAIKSIAGDDPARILKTIEQLSPTWATAAAEVKPAPVTTAVSGGPPDAGTTSAPDIAAQFERARQTNPFEAAQLRRIHGASVVAPVPN